MTTMYKSILFFFLVMGLIMVGCGSVPPFPLTATDGSETGKVVVDWVEWDHGTEATTFAVLRSTDPTTAPATWTPIGTSPGTSYDDEDAAADQAYFYAVATTDATGTQASFGIDAGYHGTLPTFTGDADAWACVTGAAAQKYSDTNGVETGTLDGDLDHNLAGDPPNKIDTVVTSLGGGVVKVETTLTNFYDTVTSPYMSTGEGLLILALPNIDGWGTGVSAYVDMEGGTNHGMSFGAYDLEGGKAKTPSYRYVTSCTPGTTQCWTNTSYVELSSAPCP